MIMRCALAAAAAGCLTVLAPGADLHVPSEYATIQAALDAAEPGDRVLIADGTYSGPGFVNLDTMGKTLTVRSENGPDACVLDGSSTPGAHAFLLSSGEHTGCRIEDLTFRSFSTSAGDEGAIRLIGSSPSIEGCIFDQCSTAAAPNPTTPGSAIALVGSTPVIRSCGFTNNEGSAFHTDADSVVYLIDCIFEDNVTRPADGRGGGAVLNEGFTLTFTSFYRRNRVEAVAGPARGGAFAHYGGMLDLTTATFEDNGVAGPDATGGSAVYAASEFVMNGNIVDAHAGEHDGAAILIDAADTVDGFGGFITGAFTTNHVGAIRIDDPDQRLEIRIGSSDFCENEHFDIEGPYFDWGANHVCCPADVDGSGAVNIADLLTVLDQWGACPECPADLNGDDLVNILDLLAVLDQWGACPELPPAN
jgi:hypothetical protein